MSKLRSVSTKIWSDTWFEDLTPNQKLLFIYLITNEKTNMLGIYEVSFKKISFETGIQRSEVEKAIKIFEEAGPVRYEHNHIILTKFLKHQNFNTNMKKSAIDVYNELPKELKDKGLSLSKETVTESFERLSNHLGMVRKIEVEYEYEYELEEEYKDESKVNNIIERENKFRLQTKKFENEFSENMINEFCDYWTERKPNGKKMLFEMQKTFDIKKRLQRWDRNNFNKNLNGNGGKQTNNGSRLERFLNG